MNEKCYALVAKVALDIDREMCVGWGGRNILKGAGGMGMGELRRVKRCSSDRIAATSIMKRVT